jgi:GNAT superfamily N-acetyltransferase
MTTRLVTTDGRPRVVIEAAGPWIPDGMAELGREADAEGIRIVSTVIGRWLDGTQRYDETGELVLVARTDHPHRIVAVGGLTRCPNVAGALRVRRFYVSPTVRRRGIAAQLARRLIDEGGQHTSVITCNAQASPAAAPFWESIGFVPVDIPGITHRLHVDVVTP